MSFRPLTFTSALVAVGLTAAGLAISVTTSSAATLDDGLVVHYDLTQASGTTVVDTSGTGGDGTVSGDTTWLGAEGLRLGGVNGHVRLPDNVIRGLTDVTVSVQVDLAADQSLPYFLWGLGNTRGSSGNGYLFATGDQFRASIASGDWSTGQTVDSGRNLARGGWRTITYTLGGGTAILYEDGVAVARKTGVTTTPGSIGDGATTANYLGRSVYPSDRFLKGKVRDFRLYGRALGAGEARELGKQTASARPATDVARLALGDTTAVTADIALPTKASGGSAISWASSRPSVVSATGVVTRPAPRTGNATVTLTATATYAGYTATRDFTATVLEDITDQQKVDNALKDVVIHDENAIRGNITLPANGDRDVRFAWRSSDPRVVTATGEVIRPPYGSKPRIARLSVTATKGYVSGTRYFTLTVLPLPKKAAMEGYLFAYFTGEADQDTEQVHFAASRGDDPLHWDELNGGRPVLRSEHGETGVRDPFVIRSPEGDRFFLVATDLQINDGRGWDAAMRHGSRYLEIWESTDLVTWSDQRHVPVSDATAGMTWAPEATYDPLIGAYVVYWASTVYSSADPDHTGSTYPRMMYSTTRDFRTFTTPQVWNDPGRGVIDSTVLRDGEYYYRLTTDEKVIGSCQRDIVLERSKDLRAVDLPGAGPRNWELVDDCVRTGLGTDWVEGPTAFKSNDGKKFYVFLDETPRRGYIPFVTDSLANPNWSIPADYQLPAKPRHGTVLPVSKAELERLRQGPPPARADKNGVIADYDLTGGGGQVVADLSGNGRKATIQGDVTRSSAGLVFGGADGHLLLPDDLTAGLDGITVSAQVRVDSAQQDQYSLWDIGDVEIGGTRALRQGNWHTITYTLSNGVARMFDDAVEFARLDGVTTKPRELWGGSTTPNSAGRHLKGKMRRLTVWNRALAPPEIAAVQRGQR
ncbi:1,4-beta-xylanase [Lentzea sp. NBC_00516]|uniref:immunoglobulin-like domain-containing protein n=1 Tax=Lentzea sp. NBC_00516 TaxID=2903582 RepID=UPI002E810679|nr:immunoglobulin-like domain-containing protein [Lentzea sp. NBC_00516]WUD27342.1 1,4-beta-xylanase [Lentzea sp. NBC_00516]